LRDAGFAILLAAGALIALPEVVGATTATLATFTTDPGDAVDGLPLSVQPVIELDSTLGTKATTGAQKSVTLGILSQPGSGATISCDANPVTTVHYVATFSGCALTGTVGTYTLKATVTGLTTGDSASFNVSAGAASTLGFTTQPADGVDGASLSVEPVVSVEDVGGNPLTSETASITLAIASGTGNLSCAANPVDTVAGAASFSDCSIVGTVGTFTLRATASGLSSATSAGFSLTIGPDYQLAFTTEPGDGAAGANLAPQPKVAVEDVGGNVVTTDAGTAISLSIASQPATGAIVNCTTNPLSTTNGKVTFAGCDIEGPTGSYELSASAAGLVSATSSTVTVSSGAAKALTFATSPTESAVGVVFDVQPVVDVVDIGGNLVSGSAASDSVKLLIASQPSSGATLSCDANPLTATNAVAAFSGCSITGPTGEYTLSATKSGLTTARSDTFQVDVGAPSQIVFSTQPDDSVDGSDLATEPVVAIEDIAGNVVPNASASISLGIASGSGSLSCDQDPLTTTDGTASFSGCSIIGTTGTNAYSLVASAAGFSDVTSTAFSLSVGVPIALTFSTQPGGGTDAIAFTSANQPKVSIEDVGGNVVTGVDPTMVSLAIAAQPGAGALFSCTANPQRTVSGKATFGGCKITGAIGDYTLVASAAGLSSATSTAFAISLGSASQLVFSTSPGGGPDGAAWSTQPVVTVEDAGGNVVPASSAVKLAIATQPASGASFSCSATTINATNGVATFDGCQITGSVGSYTITATSSGLSAALSAAFVISVADATQLVFITQPDDGVDGENLSAQPVLAFEDIGGNVVSAIPPTSVTLSIGRQSGSGATLDCDSLVDSSDSGIASFANCAIVGQIGTNSYALTASAPGFASVTSSVFSITVGPAVELAFVTAPGGGTDGLSWSSANQPKVALEDVGGNVVTGSAATPISLSIETQPATGASLSCTANPQTTVAGKATFAGCKVTGMTGTYALSASADGFAPVTSTGFSLVTGAASQLAFMTEPGDGVDGEDLSAQPVVVIEDVGNNRVFSATGSIKLSISSQPGSGATISCTANPVTASSGLATFDSCGVTGQAGTYTLSATRTGLAGASSSTFELSVGAPAALDFTTEPADAQDGSELGTEPVVAIEDVGGNVVASATSAISLAVTTGEGTLSCATNPLSPSAGVAAFSHCALTGTVGNFRLTASADGLSPATSSTVVLTLGPATSVAFETMPVGGTSSTFSTQPVVVLEDAGGNAVTSDPQYEINLTILTQPGNGANLSCATNPLVTTNGVASFRDCAISGPAGSYSLNAGASGLNSATSSSLQVTASAPVALSIGGGGLVVEASVLATNGPFTVWLVDRFGDTSTTQSDTTLSLTSSSLSGIFAASPGGSPITGLTIPGGATRASFYYGDTHAGVAVLSVQSAGLIGATLEETTTSAPPTKVSFVPISENVLAGSSFTVAAQLRDVFGNVSTTPGVALSLTSAPTGLAGTTDELTGPLGTAVFSGLTLPASGAYTLSVSGGGLGGDALVVEVGSDAPPSPIGLVASSSTAAAGAVSLVWAPPSPGTTVSTYAITPFNLTIGVVSPTTTVDGAQHEATLTGLVAGDSYDFTIVAANDAGTSAPSAPSNIVEPLGALASVSVTGTSTSLTGSATASIGGAGAIGSITVTAVGSGTVTVAQFPTPPITGAAPPGVIYFDVSVTPDSNFSLLSFRVCGVAPGQTVQWQDPLRQAFVVVSKQSAASNAQGCVSVTVDSSSVPSIDQLYGSLFAIRLQVAPASALAKTTRNGVSLLLSYTGSPIYGAMHRYSAQVLTTGTRAPTGSVTFSAGAVTLCRAPLKLGTATCTGLRSLPAGRSTIFARYRGNAGRLAVHLKLSIKKAAVKILAGALSRSTGSVRVRVVVAAPGGGTPTGVIVLTQAGRSMTRPLAMGTVTFSARPGGAILRYLPARNFLPTERHLRLSAR
jgi:hypothetical protein